MIWILLVPVLFFSFMAYRKTAVGRILRDVQKQYLLSIAHRRVTPSKIMNTSSRGRLYFLDREILNFKQGWFRDVEQILVPGSGKRKRPGVLKGNFSELRAIQIRGGKLEIEAAGADEPVRTWHAELREPEAEAIQKWIEKNHPAPA